MSKFIVILLLCLSAELQADWQSRDGVDDYWEKDRVVDQEELQERKRQVNKERLRTVQTAKEQLRKNQKDSWDHAQSEREHWDRQNVQRTSDALRNQKKIHQEHLDGQDFGRKKRKEYQRDDNQRARRASQNEQALDRYQGKMEQASKRTQRILEQQLSRRKKSVADAQKDLYIEQDQEQAFARELAVDDQKQWEERKSLAEQNREEMQKFQKLLEQHGENLNAYYRQLENNRRKEVDLSEQDYEVEREQSRKELEGKLGDFVEKWEERKQEVSRSQEIWTEFKQREDNWKKFYGQNSEDQELLRKVDVDKYRKMMQEEKQSLQILSQQVASERERRREEIRQRFQKIRFEGE